MRVPLTIGDYLERAAFVFGDREALVDEPDVPGSLGRLTYEQLYSRAKGMALALDRLGVAQGERVASVSPNSGCFLTSFFGVGAWGRVLVPINYRLNADEIRYIVEHSGTTVLLVDAELDEALRDVDAKVRIRPGHAADPRRGRSSRHRRRTRGHDRGRRARPCSDSAERAAS